MYPFINHYITKIANLFFAITSIVLASPTETIFAQNSSIRYTYIQPDTYMKYNNSNISVNYADVLDNIKKNLDLIHEAKCSQTIGAEFSKKIEEERAKLKPEESKKYLVIIDFKDCSVMLTPYRGSKSVMTDDLSSLTIYVLDLIPNPSDNTTFYKKIYIALEKDKNGDATGNYELLYSFPHESLENIEMVAKNIFGDRPYTIQSTSVRKGEFGVITKRVYKGKLKMYFRKYDNKQEAEAYIKDKTAPGDYQRQLVELISF